MKPLLVFDVESLGLHGEGFAFGYVVLDGKTGKTVEEGIYSCPVSEARFHVANMSAKDFQTNALAYNKDWLSLLGHQQRQDWNWIHANVLPHLPPPTHGTPLLLRKEFWGIWRRWSKQTGASLWAEWAWPVEARFLAACVDDGPADRYWNGPCPLNEIASTHRGFPHQSPRLPNELPIHNPLADARQSARLLWEHLQK